MSMPPFRLLTFSLADIRLTPRTTDVGLLAILSLYVLIGITDGYDAALLVSGDALFPVQFWDFPSLEFRPPPSSNLFPDLLLHGLVQVLVSDPVGQKIIVGIIIFSASAFAIGGYFGAAALIYFLALYAVSGFGFVDSTAHFSLPIMLVLHRLSRDRWFELPALFLIVFSDLLILFPIALLVVLEKPRAPLLRSVAVAAAAAACNILYSEFSVAAVQFAVAFPAFVAAALVARRLGVLRLFSIGLCVALPLIAVLEIAPARYAVPVAAAILLTLLPLRSFIFDWRNLVAPILIAMIFATTLDWERFDRVQNGYDCLADTLSARGIGVVAADHWSAKPLYMSAREGAIPLTITQMDFGEGDIHPWMAPYAFYGAPARHAVRDNDRCAIIGNDAKYCAQDRPAPVDAVERLCGNFELFSYASAIPATAETAPANKAEAIGRNLSAYLKKALSRWREVLKTSKAIDTLVRWLK